VGSQKVQTVSEGVKEQRSDGVNVPFMPTTWKIFSRLKRLPPFQYSGISYDMRMSSAFKITFAARLTTTGSLLRIG